MDESAVGTCAELIFAPIDPSFADDAPLLPSGFRIICLDSKKVCGISVFPSSFSFLLFFFFFAIATCTEKFPICYFVFVSRTLQIFSKNTN